MDEDSSQRMVFSQTRPGSVNAKASGVSKPSGQEDQEQSDHESPRSRTSPRELGRQEFVLEEAPHSSCERRARNSRLDDHLGPQNVSSSILAIRSQQTSLMLVLNDVLCFGVPRDPRYDPFSLLYSIGGNLPPNAASHIRTHEKTILSRSRHRASGTTQTSFAITSPDRIMNKTRVR